MARDQARERERIWLFAHWFVVNEYIYQNFGTMKFEKSLKNILCDWSCFRFISYRLHFTYDNFDEEEVYSYFFFDIFPCSLYLRLYIEYSCNLLSLIWLCLIIMEYPFVAILKHGNGFLLSLRITLI